MTRDTLTANPDLVGIYGTNDPEAIGAVQALAQAGKEGVTTSVGFNGDAPALELIKSGDMAATIRQDPYGQGKAAVESAAALLDGQSLTFGDQETRSIFFPVEVVTADNVDAYMPRRVDSASDLALATSRTLSVPGHADPRPAVGVTGPAHNATSRRTIERADPRRPPNHQALPRRPGARRRRPGAACPVRSMPSWVRTGPASPR